VPPCRCFPWALVPGKAAKEETGGGGLAHAQTKPGAGGGRAASFCLLLTRYEYIAEPFLFSVATESSHLHSS
jgi:hypothetical protein